ncbi:hypothetical protein DOE63_14185 [Salmonella enterica subsp. diarizonae serovar 59:z10:-]|nr:hypothetical protein DOE63_14185 [Salmonella enterica subsp. diarizonae serovar 59:z10:-]
MFPLQFKIRMVPADLTITHQSIMLNGTTQSRLPVVREPCCSQAIDDFELLQLLFCTQPPD